MTLTVLITAVALFQYLACTTYRCVERYARGYNRRLKEEFQMNTMHGLTVSSFDVHAIACVMCPVSTQPCPEDELSRKAALEQPSRFPTTTLQHPYCSPTSALLQPYCSPTSTLQQLDHTPTVEDSTYVTFAG